MNVKTKIEAKGQSRDVAAYLGAPYIHMIIPNAEEGGYLAEVLELPGCITEGETPEEAYRNLDDAMGGWIGAALDTDKPIPDPVGDKEYSGHFPLRISTELHRAAALRAIQEEVSLNQWIAKAITAQVIKESLVENLADAVAARVAERVLVDDVDVRIRRFRFGTPEPSQFTAARIEHSQQSVTDFSSVLNEATRGYRDWLGSNFVEKQVIEGGSAKPLQTSKRPKLGERKEVR